MTRRLLQPVNILVIIGLVFGIVFCIFTPFGTGFDEEHHLARVYDISGLHMLPNRSQYDKTVYFNEFHLLSYWRRFYRNEGFEQFKPESFLMRGNYDAMEIRATMSIYPPVMFFPQALVAGIAWRVFDLPIIPVTMVIRFVGLLVYLLACALTLKVLPLGRWAFLALALGPTALFQASTLNADGFSLGAGFLFTALVLAAALKPGETLTRRALTLLCLSIASLGLGKPGTVLLLPLLFLLPRRVFKSRGQVIALWAVSLAAVLFHFGWLMIGFTNTRFGQDFVAETAGSLSSQLFTYIAAFFRSFFLYAGDLFRSMIAAYGNWEGKVPALVFILYIPLVLLSLLMDARETRLGVKARLWMLATALFTSGGALVLLTSGKFATGSQETFLMIQGRYLLLGLPLVLLALSGLLPVSQKVRTVLQRVIPVGLALTLGVFFWGLYAHFYTSCGPFLFTGLNCRLPAYHNIELTQPPEVLLSAGARVEQEFTNTCKRLTAVEVMLDDGAAAAGGVVRFALEDPGGAEVAALEFDAAKLTKLQTLVLNLPADAPQAPGGYTLVLDGAALTGSLPFAVRTPSRYPGELRVAGAPFDGDLVFYYDCAPAGMWGY